MFPSSLTETERWFDYFLRTTPRSSLLLDLIKNFYQKPFLDFNPPQKVATQTNNEKSSLIKKKKISTERVSFST